MPSVVFRNLRVPGSMKRRREDHWSGHQYGDMPRGRRVLFAFISASWIAVIWWLTK